MSQIDYHNIRAIHAFPTLSTTWGMYAYYTGIWVKLVDVHLGEALGAIGSKDVLNLLEEYTRDSSIEVNKTCFMLNIS